MVWINWFLAERRRLKRTMKLFLAGIALSRDSKYIPTLRQIMGKADGEWELRKVLQALKGMTGPEARQLRLDINKRIRDTGKIGASTID